MSRRRCRRSRGQTLVEFALVSPLFILLVFAAIDFGGYFGSRLAVESAADAGARVAAIENQGATFSGTAILNVIKADQGPASLTTNVNCTWNGTTLNPNTYPPFSFTGNGCVGIWYFDLLAAPTGPPTLCEQWSVATQAWTPSTIPSGCVEPGEDVVVVGIGYRYTTLTPLPSIASGALTTYGETQILEEGLPSS